MKVKVISQGHNVKKLGFQGFCILGLTCDLEVKGPRDKSQSSLPKAMGQDQIKFVFFTNLKCCFSETLFRARR